MKLGQILVRKHVIDRAQLRAALRRQRELQMPLAEILLDMGIVSKAELMAALRTPPNASVDSLTLDRISPATLSMLPREVAEELRCIPVLANPEAMIVAMVDPFDREAIRKIEELTGRQVIPAIVRETELQRAFERKLGSHIDHAGPITDVA